jgi:hypothetical protein
MKLKSWTIRHHDSGKKVRTSMDRIAKYSFSLDELRCKARDWLAKLRQFGRISDYVGREYQNLERINPENASSDAVFAGWQPTPGGKVLGLYNVTAENHRLYRSTVSEKTLLQEHLNVPPAAPRENN